MTRRPRATTAPTVPLDGSQQHRAGEGHRPIPARQAERRPHRVLLGPAGHLAAERLREGHQTGERGDGREGDQAERGDAGGRWHVLPVGGQAHPQLIGPVRSRVAVAVDQSLHAGGERVPVVEPAAELDEGGAADRRCADLPCVRGEGRGREQPGPGGPGVERVTDHTDDVQDDRRATRVDRVHLIPRLELRREQGLQADGGADLEPGAVGEAPR